MLRKTYLCLALFLYFPQWLLAQTSYAVAPAPPAFIQEIQDSLQVLMQRYHVPGLEVALGQHTRLIWSAGLGYADIENRVPVTPQTKMRVASISKSLTSAAIGLLIAEGKLDLDAPIQRYVPSFPEKRWPITTRQLAGHLAGIRHYRNREFLSKKHYNSVLDALEVFAQDTLLFKPGTRYSYSSYGWNLISAVIEGAAKEPFLQFMYRRVFLPMHMYHTVAEHPDSIIFNRADFYLLSADSLILNAPYVDNSVKWAGGGFLSTAEDLVRFGTGLLAGELIPRNIVDTLFTSQRTLDGKKTGYGIGWRTDIREGQRIVWHTGGAVGGSAVLILYPEEQIVVALIANMQGVRLAPIGFWIGRKYQAYRHKERASFMH